MKNMGVWGKFHDQLVKPLKVLYENPNSWKLTRAQASFSANTLKCPTRWKVDMACTKDALKKHMCMKLHRDL